MGYAKIFEDMIDAKLLDLHCAYLAKVASVTGTKATVQPLGKIRQAGGTEKNRAVVSNIPIIKSAREDVKKGAIVLCVCCDRDISQAKKGLNTAPAAGHHSLSDSVVVGVL